MDYTAMFTAAFIVLPAAGLATWAWFTMVQVEDDLRSLSGFEGIHFEIGSQVPEPLEAAR